jgi:hypothetical protein
MNEFVRLKQGANHTRSERTMAAMPDVAFEAMHRQVHSTLASGFVGFLNAIDVGFRT